jgi:hypothetical protein
MTVFTKHTLGLNFCFIANMEILYVCEREQEQERLNVCLLEVCMCVGFAEMFICMIQCTWPEIDLFHSTLFHDYFSKLVQ